MVKRKKYNRTAEESCFPGNENKDTSANIYDSMFTHPAFMSLTPKQQVLYIACKMQYFRLAKKVWSADGASFSGGKKYVSEALAKSLGVEKSECFFMNRQVYAEEYHLYDANSSGRFSKDMDALIEHGLIDCVSSGKNSRTRSVYKYSTRWHNYGKPCFEVPAKVCTSSLLKKLYPQKDA